MIQAQSGWVQTLDEHDGRRQRLEDEQGIVDENREQDPGCRRYQDSDTGTMSIVLARIWRLFASRALNVEVTLVPYY
jgi:hypothetical protein